MATYQTEQKKELLSFLRKNSSRAFTIDEICKGMKNDQECISPPGKSTVYRLIPKLLEENSIRQFSGGKRRITYQIMDGAFCSRHIHLKCTACGRIFHLSDGKTSALVSLLRDSENFFVNAGETILYGKCEACSRGE